MYVRRVRTVKLLKFGNSVCIESFGTISIYIYFIFEPVVKFINETCKFRYTKEQSHSRFDDDVRGDSLPLPFLSRNIVYVILQTWNLGASFSICGKLRFIDFPPPFIFPPSQAFLPFHPVPFLAFTRRIRLSTTVTPRLPVFFPRHTPLNLDSRFSSGEE